MCACVSPWVCVRFEWNRRQNENDDAPIISINLCFWYWEHNANAGRLIVNRNLNYSRSPRYYITRSFESSQNKSKGMGKVTQRRKIERNIIYYIIVYMEWFYIIKLADKKKKIIVAWGEIQTQNINKMKHIVLSVVWSHCQLKFILSFITTSRRW